jgi:hypothetical protein
MHEERVRSPRLLHQTRNDCHSDICDDSWVSLAAGKCIRRIPSIVDEVKDALVALTKSQVVEAKQLSDLKRRNLIKVAYVPYSALARSLLY